MKNILKTSLLLAILSTTLFAFMPTKNALTESELKVIVLVNHADWCPVCKANGTRVKSEVISKFTDNPKYKIVVNDLTNKKTSQSSKSKCKAAGIDGFASKNKSTGTIFFIKSTDKSLISSISVSETTEKITEAFNNSITNQ